MENKQANREGYLHEHYRYFHLHDTAGQERSFHYHDFDKIVLLRSGNVDYVVEDVTYKLTPGSVLLVKNRAIHKAIIDKSEPYDRVIIYLDHTYLGRLMPEAGLMDCFGENTGSGGCLFVPDEEQESELSAILADYEKAAEDRRFGAEALRDSLVIRMMVCINRIVRESKDSAVPSNEIMDEKVKNTVEYIEKNISSELTVEALAERVFLSRYHFMRLFKANTGSTVHAYITQKRLLYAARLIREGKSTGAAAEESGFKDYSSFHRAFSESFGIKPSDLKSLNL